MTSHQRCRRLLPAASLAATLLGWPDSAAGASVHDHLHAHVAPAATRTRPGTVPTLVLAALVVATAVVSVAALARMLRGSRRATGRRRDAKLAAFACMLTIVTATTVAVSAARSTGAPDAPRPGTPLLETVNLGGRTVSIFVTPQRPGLNLVRVSAPIRLTLHGVAVPLRRAADGSWSASLWLGRGSHPLEIGGAARVVDVDADEAGPTTYRLVESLGASRAPGGTGSSEAECVARSLGHVVAVAEANAAAGRTRFSLVASAGSKAATTTTTSAHIVEGALPDCAGRAVASPGATVFPALLPGVDSSDVGAPARAFGRLLNRLGERSVTIVTDGTDRSKAFASALRRALPRVDVRPVQHVDARSATDAVVIASGWDGVAAAIDGLRRLHDAGSRGVFLAPWLLVPRVFGDESSWGSPQLTIGLPFDPVGDGATRYLEAMARFAPGQPPTSAGFAGYLEARVALQALTHGISASTPAGRRTLSALTRANLGDSTPNGVQFFTPADIQILPPGLDHDHSDAPSWLDTGSFAAVSSVIASASPGRASKEGP